MGFFFLEDYESQEWKSLSFYQIMTAGFAQAFEFRNPHFPARSCLSFMLLGRLLLANGAVLTVVVML